MNTLKEYCEEYCRFLKDWGYLTSKTENNIITYKKDLVEIQVSFDIISYELSCQFIDNNNRSFTLQDMLSFCEIFKMKGMYQIGDKSQLLQGVKYLAKAIQLVLERYDISNIKVFNKLYEYRIKMRDKLLDKYYFETDMKKAEQCWSEKNYNDVKLLYEKHKDNLSKMQIKRLEYIDGRK